jgi:2-polyprenyl-6-methoxyphenol hydroxylase-like FAD-dependent oxidoreductase
MLNKTTDVLIVGAGPVGMALAITLAQSGVRPLVIERAEQQETTSRAAVIHAHTLEILDRLGVSNPMLSEGLKIEKFAFRERDRRLGLIKFDSLPSEHRYLLMLPQDRTEAIMLDRLAKLGVEIARGCTFQSYAEDRGRVIATVETVEGTKTIEAKYLVGTDGMHSEVRKSCGIPYDGAQYEGSFVLADVALEGSDPRDEVTLFFSPEGLVVLAPLPGNRYRVVATVDHAPENPDAELVQKLLDARGPAARRLGKVRDVTWSSRFHLHHRLARSYRKGRVFIAGDAAHAHSPAGGQGMNTGLVDAYTLGSLLANVLSGRASEQALDQYEALRRPAAAKVLELAGALTSAATVASPWKRRMRNLALSLVSKLPVFRERLALNLSGISRRSATVSL